MLEACGYSDAGDIPPTAVQILVLMQCRLADELAVECLHILVVSQLYEVLLMSFPDSDFADFVCTKVATVSTYSMLPYLFNEQHVKSVSVECKHFFSSHTLIWISDPWLFLRIQQPCSYSTCAPKQAPMKEARLAVHPPQRMVSLTASSSWLSVRTP